MVLQFDSSDVSMDMSFHRYSDADWSGDPETSQFTSGFMFISNWGTIGWGSKHQSMDALSSTESEYIGLCYAGQHPAYLQSFGYGQKEPMELLCDNQAAIMLSKDPQFRACTKHIQRKYHFLRDNLVRKGEAVIRYSPRMIWSPIYSPNL
jgi:hypothetical protein